MLQGEAARTHAWPVIHLQDEAEEYLNFDRIPRKGWLALEALLVFDDEDGLMNKKRLLHKHQGSGIDRDVANPDPVLWLGEHAFDIDVVDLSIACNKRNL